MVPPVKKGKMEKKYYKQTNKPVLETCRRGFFATCNFREKDCIRECYNILNEYAKKLYGSEWSEQVPGNANYADERNVDVADQLCESIAATSSRDQRAKSLFQAVDTRTTNCVFIRTSLTDPVELGFRIVSDIAEKRIQKTRFLLRLVPIEAVCSANMPAIVAAVAPLLEKHFPKEKSTTFAIIYNKRHNNEMRRDECISQLAALIQSRNANNRVDLRNAVKTMLVEITKGFCCLSVLEKYNEYKRYNLVELANAKDVSPQAANTEVQQADTPPVDIAQEAAPKNDNKEDKGIEDIGNENFDIDGIPIENPEEKEKESDDKGNGEINEMVEAPKQDDEKEEDEKEEEMN